MGTLLCISGIGAILLFYYLLDTARKKTTIPNAGKNEHTPVYLSIADDPDAVIQGMDRFVAEVQKTSRPATNGAGFRF